MSEIRDQDQQASERDEQSFGAAGGEARPEDAVEQEAVEVEGEVETSEPAGEADVLRNELMRLQEELAEAKQNAQEMRDRYLRARADLENYRKRAAADADRARDAGLDSAVLPVLSVFDDLRRALDAAAAGDPEEIIPGVQSVLATLERNLENLGIESLGSVGERFDPDVHEALTTIPSAEPEDSETIAEVFQLGFRKGGRLIRPARVVVYQS